MLHFPFPSVDLSNVENKELYDGIVTLANKIAEQKRELYAIKCSGKDLFGEESKKLQADIDKTKHQIDHSIYKLYGLNEEDIKRIEQGPI